MNFFLVIYDRSTGKLVEEPRQFSENEREAANAARFARELEERLRPEIEVVLLGADSLEALQKTHSRYFKSLKELLAG